MKLSIIMFILISIIFIVLTGCLDNQSPSFATPSPTITVNQPVPTTFRLTDTTTPPKIQSITGKYQATNDPTIVLEFREDGALIIKGYDKYDQATWQKGKLDIDQEHLSDTKIIPGEGFVVKAHDTTCKLDQSPYLYRTGFSTATMTFTNYEDCTIMQPITIRGNKLTLLGADWVQI